MAESNWGLCKDCEWWQIEPDADVTDTTMGLCREDDLQPLLLRVAGNSGCNQFSPSESTRAAGSGETPPTAQPQ